MADRPPLQTRVELDANVCPDPHCIGPHPYLIASVCGGRTQPSIVLYDRARGVIQIYCAGCRELFKEILVAGALPS